MSTEDTVPIIDQDVLDSSTNQFQETPSSTSDPTSTNSQPSSTLPKQANSDSLRVPELHVYVKRWYILGLFCLLGCHQCLVWNTWGPVASSVQEAYGWSDGTVAMMANWGTIMFLLSVLPLSKLVEVKLSSH